jgi:hypothetical protein
VEQTGNANALAAADNRNRPDGKEMMRETIVRAMLGTVIGMGIATLLGFVKFSIAEKISPSGGLIPVPSGLTAAILIAVLMGIVGGIIGLIVGAFGLRPYQGAVVGILFIVLRLREVSDAIRSIATKIHYGQQAGHFSFGSILDDILVLSMVFDFVIVGALVSIFLRRFFPR